MGVIGYFVEYIPTYIIYKKYNIDLFEILYLYIFLYFMRIKNRDPLFMMVHAWWWNKYIYTLLYMFKFKYQDGC